jgi:hypothetical protein
MNAATPAGPATPAGGATDRMVPARFRSVEAAALAGLAHAVLFVAAIALFRRAPGPDADPAVITEWYGSSANQRATVVGLNLLVFATIAFLWFVAVIRRRVGERENRFFGTVFLGSALLLAAMWLVGAMAAAVPALSAYVYGYQPTLQDVALWRGAAVVTFLVLVARLQAVFILSTTTVIRLAGSFPRPIVGIGYATAFVLLVVPLPSELLHWVFPGWVAVVSASAFIRRRRAGSVVEEAGAPGDRDGVGA